MPEAVVEQVLKTLHILLADDDDHDRKDIKRSLKQCGLPSICSEASSIEDALKACQAGAFDCAIVDYQLPGQDGLAGITALHESCPYMAIIMLTGLGDETVAVQAMQRGALDYMSKKDLDAQSIRRSIENAVAKASLLKKVAEQRSELEVFSQVLVHDLMSPIHSALGFASLMEENIHKGKQENVVLILRQGDQGLEAYGRIDCYPAALREFRRAGCVWPGRNARRDDGHAR